MAGGAEAGGEQTTSPSGRARQFLEPSFLLHSDTEIIPQSHGILSNANAFELTTPCSLMKYQSLKIQLKCHLFCRGFFSSWGTPTPKPLLSFRDSAIYLFGFMSASPV